MARSIKDSLELYDSSMKNIGTALAGKGVNNVTQLSKVAAEIRKIVVAKPYLSKTKLYKFATSNSSCTSLIFTSSTPSVSNTTDLSKDGKGGVLGWVSGTTMYIGTPNKGEKVKIDDASNLLYNSVTYSVATLPAEDVLLTREYWDNYLDTLEVEEMAEAIPSVQLKQTLDLKGLNASIGSVGSIDSVESIEQIDKTELENIRKATAKEQILNEIFDGDSINADVMPLATGNLFRNLTSIDVAGLDTSECENFSYAFSWLTSCTEIKNINSLDMSTATDVSYLFYYTGKLTKLDLSSWTLRKVVNASYMFHATSLNNNTLDISGFRFSSNLKDISYMFYGVWFTDVPDGINTWTVTNVETVEGLFYNNNSFTKNISITGWTLPNCKNFEKMFYACHYLTGVTLSYVTATNVSDASFRDMFRDCWEITNINLSRMDFKGVATTSSMVWMFYNCSKLKKIIAKDWTGKTNVSNCTQVFQNCSSALSGGITYSSSKITGAYCRRSTGYFSAS